MFVKTERILYLLPTLGRGGAERVVARLSLESARTNEVFVAAFNAANPAFEFGGTLIDLNLPARAGLTRATQLVRRAVRLRGLLREYRPDRILSFSESTSIPLLLGAPRASRPSVTVSIRTNPFRTFGKFRLSLIVRLYRRSGRLVLQTEKLRSQMIQIWPELSAIAQVIPNPVPDALLDAPRSEVHRKPHQVVTCCRLDPVKGLDILLQALSETDPSLNLYLKIVGGGPEQTRLETLAKELKIQDRVEFIGAVQDVIPYLDTCGVFVLTSEWEGFPNALAEAMARGCCCISTACEFGPDEMITDKTSGLLLPVGDIDALRMALEFTSRNRDAAQRMGEAARLRAHDWSLTNTVGLWLSDRSD